MREAGPGVPALPLAGEIFPARGRALLRRQLPRRAAQDDRRRYRPRGPGGMGPGPGRELARCGLVLPRAQGRRCHRAADRRLRAGEVVVADSTSVNLFKLAAALLRRSEGRRTVVTERGNFPTDVYILEGLADLFGERFDLVLAEYEALVGSIDDAHRAGAADPRPLPHRRHARHGAGRGALRRPRRARDLGPQPFRRRGAARAQRLGGRVRCRLHLQVPERGARRAGVHLHGGERHRGA